MRVTIGPEGDVLARSPGSPCVNGISVSPEALNLCLTDPEALAVLTAAAGDFTVFLGHWRFTPRGERPKMLGSDLWPAQETYAQAAAEHRDIIMLKARQLGESTTACAYDGFVARFGPANAAVSITSQRDEGAKLLLEQVIEGLEHLPPVLRLPLRVREHSVTILAGKNDHRVVRAFPANSPAVRGTTCLHAHVDEAAMVEHQRKAWQAVSESVKPGGSIHVISTAAGSADFFAEQWRAAEEGNSRLHPVFVDALQRPDRQVPGWYEQKKAETDVFTLRQELPLTVADALSGGGEYRFDAEALDDCTRYPLGLGTWQPDRLYVIGVDVGEKDGTCLVCLDVTGDQTTKHARGIAHVVGFKLMRPTTILDAQREIEQWSRDWPRTIIAVEDNGIGRGLIPNLRIPNNLIPFNTSGISKPRLISNLALSIQRGEIQYDPAECPDLDKELRGYKEPDDAIRQDAVMALGIALDCAPLAWRARGGAKVLTW